MLHLHIGPSPLALGLLAPTTLAAGFDVCLIGPSGDKSPTEYVFSGSDPDGQFRIYRVDWFEGPQILTDLPDDLRERIGGEEPLLLTATLRDRIGDRRQLIEELLRARPGEAETTMLACENAPDPAYGEIAASCDQPGFQMLRTVVNRMCVRLPRDSEGRRVVSAHSLGEWLVERPAGESRALRILAGVPEVELVDDIDARHDRKLWMVNGAHQALALFGRQAGVRELTIPGRDDVAEDTELDDLRVHARDRGIRQRLEELHQAMVAGLQSRHEGLEDSLEYGYRHVRAYGEHPDSIDRVLGAMKRSDLAPFVVALDARLAEPARVCFELRLPLRPFERVFDIFEDLMRDLDAFADAEAVRRDPALVTAEGDRRALAAYARLLRGWTENEAAVARLRNFAKGLAISRPW